MNIAYFNANMRIGQDGVTRVMYRMMEAARHRGHAVLALTSTLPDPGQTDIPMVKVPSVVLPLQKAYRIALPGYHHFAPQLRSFRPDLLHINSPCTLGFAAAKYARHFGVPVVATYHTHFPTYPRYYHIYGAEEMTWRLIRSLYNSLDRTFVPTEPIRRELVANGVDRTVYVPNGVDTHQFSPTRRSMEWRRRINASGGKTIVLFVSRLVWEKDLRDLAKTYQWLRAHRADFEMVIVGDGYARKGFEAMMPGAHFLGYQTGTPLAESFASSDIFVFPSTTETFGLVTAEAMASGLAPVAAGYGGAVELIEDGCSGFLTTPHRPVEMAERVSWLLDHPHERRIIQENALQRARQFSWDTILPQIFDHYRDVIRLQSQRRRSAA